MRGDNSLDYSGVMKREKWTDTRDAEEGKPLLDSLDPGNKDSHEVSGLTNRTEEGAIHRARCGGLHVTCECDLIWSSQIQSS